MPSDTAPATATASLEILTGAARGTACWLVGASLDLSLDSMNRLQVAVSGDGDAGDVIARLHRAGDSYAIESLGDRDLFINGERVTSTRLDPRDLIEFGDAGPLTRFRLHYQGDRLRRSLGDMLDDAIDYTRASRKPGIIRLQRATRELVGDFVLRTTLVFRVGVIIAIGILAAIAWQQYQAGVELRQQAQSRGELLADFARSLARTSEEALRPADLNQLRQELRYSLSDTAQRLEQLEKRTEATKRIIAGATRSVMFLQGAWGFRDAVSKRMLRYQTDGEGHPLFSLRGEPLLTLEGAGEIARIEFTGTAFVINATGALLTNRHVAQPWEDDAGLEEMLARGLEPLLIRFQGYLPGIEEAFAIELLHASDAADLALLRCREVPVQLSFLRLGEREPRPGDEVIVMGYPTGMRAMLAQTGEAFLAELEQAEQYDFWRVAESLSGAGFIRPLASRGIVAQRSEATLVYDADTTHGGSGGPVLDINGDVIAINTAIIPGFGGSNIGIPVEFARRLLAEAGVEVE